MNFSLTEDWINSLYLRYDVDKIINIDGIYFYKNNNYLTCMHYFDFKLTKLQTQEIYKYIESGFIIRFKYINENCYNHITKAFINCNLQINILDIWQAPIIEYKNIDSYIKNCNHKQIKRNYNFYLKNKSNYIILDNSKQNFLKLWSDVLKIDFYSWKKEEKSDMKSLDREDLQYLPYCLNNKEKCNLNVIYNLLGEPLAYSLMFLGDNNYWYAVKWGASNNGRKAGLGFCCLFNHLDKLSVFNNGLIKLDFWGRRNKTYDELKSGTICRLHFEISKRNDKNGNNNR